MSVDIVSEEYEALEFILLEYVERFGLTQSARQFFGAQKSADKNVEQMPAFARRAM